MIIRRILKYLTVFICICAALLAGLIMAISISEYKPRGTEELEILTGDQERMLCVGERVEILSYNIGYAGLDKSMDYFLDGGQNNLPESREQVEENLQGILAQISERDYDAILLQEVDRNSRRSYRINEERLFSEKLNKTSIFAQNFRCLFIPYPIPEMTGSVNAGLLTLTDYAVRSAQRIALPTSFAWPVRACQLKRCLLVTRIPVENSGSELVLINLHMEAYDDGTGKAAQTEILMEFVRNEYELGNYVIAGGDFNQAFPDDDFSTYPVRNAETFVPGRLEKEMLEGEWTFASDRTNPTCRLLDHPYDPERWWAQYYVIDGFILSPNVRLEEVETIDEGFEFSDHNPVRLSVTLER